jgi:hypothetical protein
MLDWLASVAVVRRSERRIELAITAPTRWAGWAISALSTIAAGFAWSWLPMLAALPGVLGVVGLLLATTRRRLVFDRDEGLLRVEQRIFGVRSRLAVPLFHLRAVVVAAEQHHFVAYLERRAGGRIRIDDSRQLAPLLAIGRAICEVTQLRLVSEAPRTSSSAS